MEWWQRIRIIRDAKGWSQADLVRRVQKLGGSLTTSYLNQIERGRARNAGIAVLTPIPDALEVAKSAVLGDDYDARLDKEKDAIVFVTEQSLERFIAEGELSSRDAVALRAMQNVPQCPRDVDGWRRLFPNLDAFAKARSSVVTDRQIRLAVPIVDQAEPRDSGERHRSIASRRSSLRRLPPTPRSPGAQRRTRHGRREGPRP